ncbi:hypothetical protein ACS0TY_002757 [Phlomoides rotata]
MAGVLETLSVLRASALPFASLPPVVGSNSVRFSDFQGLKIQPIRASVKLSSTQKLARRGSRIICEAQETDIQVQGLQVLYTSLNSPSLLTGWKSSGGDPCGESWKGITCQGSSIVAGLMPMLHAHGEAFLEQSDSGLGLNGTMGYLLNNLAALKTLDLSNNNIHDIIPYQLPANLTSLNLAANNISGNLPYSLSSMGLLNYLNISRNMLSQVVGDVFVNHSALDTLEATDVLLSRKNRVERRIRKSGRGDPFLLSKSILKITPRIPRVC